MFVPGEKVMQIFNTIMKNIWKDRGVRRMLFTALVLSSIVATWNGLTSYADNLSMYLRISIKTPESGSGVLFYDIGKQYNPQDLSSAFIPGDGQFHEVRFKLPVLNNIYNLRFDPPSVKTGEIAINQVDLIDHYGKLLQRFDLSRLKPIDQIKQLSYQQGEVRFSIDEPGDDPKMDLRLDRPISVDRHQFVRMFLRGILLEGAALFLAGFILIFIWSRFNDKTIATLVVLALFAALWFLQQGIVDAQKGAVSSYLRVSMMSDVRGVAKVYYDRGRGLNEGDAIEMEVSSEPNYFKGRANDSYKDYSFPIPGRFFQLRFDPLAGEGTVTIRSIEITDTSGKVLKTVPFDHLKPNADIKTFEKREQELVIVMSKGAGDPQIEIRHAERLSPDPLQTFPWTAFLRDILLKWAIVGILLLVAVGIRLRYAPAIIRFIDGPLFQKKMHLVYLGCTLAMVLAMAAVSNPQGNPDELGHGKCAAYYIKAWLPSSVDSEAVLETLSGYGVSYLFRLEIIYFLAGKVALILSRAVDLFYLSLRLFNVLLFALLVAVAIHRTRNPLLFVLGLVATPQVWYIFSYFNGDAFALFAALIIAAQVMYPDSLTGRYLERDVSWRKFSGALAVGFFTGLLLLSKPNYYVYIAFVAVIVTLHLFFDADFRWTPQPARQLKKGLLIGGIALCIYLPPTIYDQYVNGFQKEERIIRVNEKHAAYEFRASTVQNKPLESYRGLALRDKGVKFRELFLEWDEWRQMSFKGFFGVYGYFLYYSKPYHFQAVLLLLAGSFLFALFYSAYHSLPRMDALVLSLALLFSILAVGQSVYFSWTADYQPQGRYLFPIIPIVLTGLTRLPNLIRQRLVPCLSLCLFLFSLTSFVFTALMYIPKVD